MTPPNNGSSVPIALGMGGIAVVLLTIGLTGNKVGDVFQGNFGHIGTIGPGGSGGGGSATTVPGSQSGIATTTQVQAGGNSPANIVAMINWCNSVSGKYDYTWGGGHGSIGQPSSGPCSSNGGGSCNGYDCSGAVSGALGAAGYLSSPLVSGDLASWGVPGMGKYVTVWANKTHTFMRIQGHWFGTGILGKGGGVDWGNFDPNLAAYSMRKPASE